MNHEMEKIFCRFCGYRLKQNDTISQYDEYTGEPVQPLLHQKICPNKYCKSHEKGAWG